MEVTMICGIICLWMSIGVVSSIMLRYLQRDRVVLQDFFVYGFFGIVSLVIVLVTLYHMNKNKIFIDFKK